MCSDLDMAQMVDASFRKFIRGRFWRLFFTLSN